MVSLDERACLTHADTVIKLGSDVVQLVARQVVLDRKGRIVSTDLGHVHILSVAELYVTIAFLCVGRR